MKKYIDRSLSFDDYIDLIKKLLSDGKTTGPVQSQAKTAFTKLNLRRMERLGKTTTIDGELIKIVGNIDRPMIWLTITEAWCGDAAQNIPLIEKIAAGSDKIRTRYILRDANAELMDRFLSDGNRSIPKLIVLDAIDLSVLETWGPRPEAAQTYFAELKAGGLDRAEMMERVQVWYNADKGRSLFAEFTALMRELKGLRAVTAAA